MRPKQNLTIQLERDTISKAKLLAAVRSTSVSMLVAELIERLVRDDDRYREAERLSLRLMKKGFHLGGKHQTARSELHER